MRHRHRHIANAHQDPTCALQISCSGTQHPASIPRCLHRRSGVILSTSGSARHTARAATMPSPSGCAAATAACRSAARSAARPVRRTCWAAVGLDHRSVKLRDESSCGQSPQELASLPGQVPRTQVDDVELLLHFDGHCAGTFSPGVHQPLRFRSPWVRTVSRPWQEVGHARPRGVGRLLCRGQPRAPRSVPPARPRQPEGPPYCSRPAFARKSAPGSTCPHRSPRPLGPGHRLGRPLLYRILGLDIGVGHRPAVV